MVTLAWPDATLSSEYLVLVSYPELNMGASVREVLRVSSSRSDWLLDWNEMICVLHSHVLGRAL